ncbi:MAG: saccharopine dehydrogenase NADP-binding domain-containing protein [Alcanivorax sp.]|nr:saccharopine dehydrogenase NADP-binding domain-containing protein [Alcanivorax sp.]
MQWMIYGANGYTGELIAREAVSRGLKPVLAGRNENRLQPLASGLGLPWRAFTLDDPASVAAGLAGIDLVLHCAGPFSATSSPMIEGCLAAGAHYLDITGEIPVFEHARAQHERARAAGVLLCPGVGFDVIPTDCVALRLKELVPDATHLSLGFETASGLSPGTAKTVVEGLGNGCQIRRDGRIQDMPLAWGRRRIDFGQGPRRAMTIPWGDVSTAYSTTGIANIDTWVPLPAAAILGARLGNLVRPLLGSQWLQGKLKGFIDRNVKGPDASTRARLPTWVWGEARNADGTGKVVRIRTANGYSLTIDGALAVTAHLLNSQDTRGGYSTPAALLGAELITQLPGSGEFAVSDI